MSDEAPIRTAVRRSRRAEQNRCLLCGRRKRIELHHCAGKNHDPPFVVPLCPACHALVTENLRLADVEMRYEADANERVRRSLKASAVFLELLASAHRRWAELLPTLPKNDGRTNHKHRTSGHMCPTEERESHEPKENVGESQ
jgi:hypothetical protein